MRDGVEVSTPSFEMTWGSTTSSGYCSQEDSDSEFEQYFTARTSFFRKPRKDIGKGFSRTFSAGSVRPENNVPALKMGGSGSKSRGFWPFAGSGIGSDPANGGNEQTLSRLRGSRSCTPFVFTRRSSLYYDEDGDLAHEFYEETIVTKNGRKRAKLKKIQKNLIPQGMVKLDHPRIHVDFPVVLCEV
ncbi:UNVERIFIED_CONTAM: hypothetical protein FKN15_032077 [Acipenser sinensis]